MQSRALPEFSHPARKVVNQEDDRRESFIDCWWDCKYSSQKGKGYRGSIKTDLACDLVKPLGYLSEELQVNVYRTHGT